MQKNLFDPATAQELQTRLQQLQPNSPRQWGKMDASQMLAHCSAGLDMGFGELSVPRAPFPLNLVGRVIKPFAVGGTSPMRRNLPTAKELLVARAPEIEAERQRLSEKIARFHTGGPSVCTANPHPFFGRLTPQEWAALMYKHLDHHFRQFSI